MSIKTVFFIIFTIDMFVEELENEFTIVELARTGITSLERGEGSFTDDI